MRVAVPSISFSQHPQLREELLAEYPDTKFNEAFVRHSKEELTEWLKGCDAAIMGLEPLTDEMLSQLPDLKVISRMGVGVDNVDPDLLNKHGIRIGWTGGTNAQSVADLTIAYAINGLRHVAPLYAEMRDGGRPRQKMGRQLGDRVVGVHGCGHVGKRVVRLFRAFGCEVLVNDIRDFSDFYAEVGATAVSFDELIERSEVLTIHIPLNDRTRLMYDAEVLSRLRPDCVLINIARGGLVDEDALRDVLLQEKIAAACFDVFSVEPPTDDALLTAPNFLCTPHIGGSAAEARLAMGRAAIRGLRDTFEPKRGEIPFD